MVSTVASRPEEAASVAARTKLVIALLLAACAGAPELAGLARSEYPRNDVRYGILGFPGVCLRGRPSARA